MRLKNGPKWSSSRAQRQSSNPGHSINPILRISHVQATDGASALQHPCSEFVCLGSDSERPKVSKTSPQYINKADEMLHCDVSTLWATNGSEQMQHFTKPRL